MAGRIDFNAQKVAALIKAGGSVAKPGDNRIVRDFQDAVQTGLWLRIGGPGKARWTFRYQLAGKRNWILLGQASDRVRGHSRVMSLAEARDTAADCMRMVRLGQDPKHSRELARAAEAAELQRQAEAAEAAAVEQRKLEARVTFGDALALYLEHGEREALKRGKEPDRERARILNVEVLPVLGRKKLAEVTNNDVMRIVRKGEGVSGHKAKKIYVHCRAFFNWCLGRPDQFELSASPLTSEQPEHESERARVLDVEEIRTFLGKLPEAPMVPALRTVLELQLRLGQRVGEVLKMRRHDLKLSEDAWVIPGRFAKNGKPTRVPLPPKAKALIQTALEDDTDTEWLFPAKDTGTHFKSEVAAKAMLRSQALFGMLDEKGNPRVDGEGRSLTITSHDLRRTAATCLEAMEVPVDVIQLILNHSSGKGVTNRYARADRFEVAYDALLRWEVALDRIMAGENLFAVSADDRKARAERIRAEMQAVASQ